MQSSTTLTDLSPGSSTLSTTPASILPSPDSGYAQLGTQTSMAVESIPLHVAEELRYNSPTPTPMPTTSEAEDKSPYNMVPKEDTKRPVFESTQMEEDKVQQSPDLTENDLDLGCIGDSKYRLRFHNDQYNDEDEDWDYYDLHYGEPSAAIHWLTPLQEVQFLEERGPALPRTFFALTEKGTQDMLYGHQFAYLEQLSKEQEWCNTGVIVFIKINPYTLKSEGCWYIDPSAVSGSNIKDEADQEVKQQTLRNLNPSSDVSCGCIETSVPLGNTEAVIMNGKKKSYKGATFTVDRVHADRSQETIWVFKS
ncbi:hypothetical protein BU26DRAFT_514228 [Trematosphaeria pertusa]|uniref:Uncharacterized protein n=1 Tax=Trematosphaeria pertusa TaxID=390896 RepID=A0A6A6IUM3_9PLEO|nr:uncharacterized protein BU26DRAFT_514228 [Trematosphaeria pertusa]KAF2254265.1 hypothetical protein BU26DRAFT_514228 [Trematosphaeria pertusa]